MDSTAKNARQKPLERASTPAQDSPEAQAVSWETEHAPTETPPKTPTGTETRHRRRRRTVLEQNARPEYMAFADKVRDAMNRKGLSASDVARLVWGSTKDARGTVVARNRDRMGAYLAGVSLPDPTNLEALGQVLDIPVAELELTFPPKRRLKPGVFVSLSHRKRDSLVSDLNLGRPQGPDLHRLRLTLDKDLPWRLALEIFEMVKEAELAGEATEAEPDMPELGAIVK
jgi:hypothetical protein